MPETIDMHGLTDRDIIRTRRWIINRVRLRGWYNWADDDTLESALDEGIALAISSFRADRGANIHTWITRCALQHLKHNLGSDRRYRRLAADIENPDGSWWSDHWEARPESPEPPAVGMGVLLSTPHLTDRERQFLEMRFVEGMRLAAISKLVGLSRERVRQIQMRGLAKIRRHLLLLEWPVGA